eukprot:Seg6083.1 transcript_id=Seg6083.1/GoldUCD/mRNA.D3Y31 product="hypothetical protein" protein_id=Seg6083.1/GoldUCD/D3Y31
MESTIHRILEAFRITANKEKQNNSGSKDHSNRFRGFLSNEKDTLADNKSMWNSEYGLFGDSQTVSLRANELYEYDSAEGQDLEAGLRYRRNDKSPSLIDCEDNKSSTKSRTRKLGVPGQSFTRSVSLEGDRAKELSNMVEEWETGEPVGSERLALRRSSSLDFSIGTNSPLTDDLADYEVLHDIHMISDDKPAGYTTETNRYQRHSLQEFMDDAIGVYAPNDEERCIKSLEDTKKNQGRVRAFPQDHGSCFPSDMEAKYKGSCSKVVTQQNPTSLGHPMQRDKSSKMIIKAASMSSEVASMGSGAAANTISRKNIGETSTGAVKIGEPYQTRENYLDDAIMQSTRNLSKSNVDIAAYERWIEASEEFTKDASSTQGFTIAHADTELRAEVSNPEDSMLCYDEKIAHARDSALSDVSSQNSTAGKNPHKSETVLSMNINNGAYFVGKEQRSANRRASFNGLSAVKEDSSYLQGIAVFSESLNRDTNSSLDKQPLASKDENIKITKALSSLDINGNEALQPHFYQEQEGYSPEMRQHTESACENQMHMPSESKLISVNTKESCNEFQGIPNFRLNQGGQVEEPLWHSQFVMGGDFHDMQRNASNRHMRLRRDSPFAFPMIEELARNMGREAVARGISAAGENKLFAANLGPGHCKQKYKRGYCS